MDRDTSVCIATCYGLDGSWIESRYGRDFPHLSSPALGPTQSPVQWIPGLSRGWRAAGAWRWPLLVPWSRKRRAIPLLSLWAVRPAQSLSACTRVHCDALYLYLTYVVNTPLLLFLLCMLFDYNKTSFVRQCLIFYEQTSYERFVFWAYRRLLWAVSAIIHSWIWGAACRHSAREQ